MPLYISFICLLTILSKNVYGNSPSTVDTAEYNILAAIHDTFIDKFNKEKEADISDQFAVLYYGGYQKKDNKGFEVKKIIKSRWVTCKNVNGGKYFLKTPKVNFDPSSCYFVAGRATKDGLYHPVISTVWSFRSVLNYKYEDYDVGGCPKPAYPPDTLNAYAKLYMVTKYRPCACCTDNILKFAQRCIKKDGANGAYTHLIVGYDDKSREQKEGDEENQNAREAAEKVENGKVDAAFTKQKDYASLVWIDPIRVTQKIQKPQEEEDEEPEQQQPVQQQNEPPVEKKVQKEGL